MAVLLCWPSLVAPNLNKRPTVFLTWPLSSLRQAMCRLGQRRGDKSQCCRTAAVQCNDGIVLRKSARNAKPIEAPFHEETCPSMACHHIFQNYPPRVLSHRLLSLLPRYTYHVSGCIDPVRMARSVHVTHKRPRKEANVSRAADDALLHNRTSFGYCLHCTINKWNG